MADEQKAVEPGKGKANYYKHLVEQDVIGWLAPLAKKRGWKYRDGDKRLVVEQDTEVEVPWSYVRASKSQDCWPVHHIFLNEIAPHVRLQFIPSLCHSCYKVVIRPKTLKQLFLLEKFMKEEITHACKCGIEVRPYTLALYGGYCYFRTLEDGQDGYKEIREKIDNYKGLGPEVGIILKRGCTEIERRYGDSSKWLDPTPEQIEIERRIFNAIVYNPVGHTQMTAFLVHVHRRWIEWAAEHGDMTYLEFTGGLPLQPPPRTYHEEIEK